MLGLLCVTSTILHYSKTNIEPSIVNLIHLYNDNILQRAVYAVYTSFSITFDFYFLRLIEAYAYGSAQGPVQE